MEIPCKISKDHKHANRIILSLEQYKLLLQVIFPLKEGRFDVYDKDNPDEFIFNTSVRLSSGQTNQIIYFKVLHPEYIMNDIPRKQELLFGMAEYYLNKFDVKHTDFAISKVPNGYRFGIGEQDLGDVVFDEAV